MKHKIEQLIRDSIATLQHSGEWLDFALPVIDVTRPKSETFGDYTSNIALVLAKFVGESPMEIAEVLKETILNLLDGGQDNNFEAQNGDVGSGLPRFARKDRVSKIEVVQPGYINFTLKQEYFTELVQGIVREQGEFGSIKTGAGKKVLIEFISANPTGPIHLGNARGGPSGDILANVLEKTGCNVDREYYVNDFGNQVRVLGHSILKDEEAQYKGDYVDDLAIKLDSAHIAHTPVEVGFWAARTILDTIIKPTCEKAGIHFQNFFSERELHTSGAVDVVLQELKEKDLAYEQDNALWFRSTQFGDDKDRVLVKSDDEKSKTYTASDLAYHKNKLSRDYDLLINIQGADHLSQAAVVKRFVEDVLGAKDQLHLIVTQFVRIIKDGIEVKMSKRKGVYFAWDDLIEEVGRDAVRFIFASYAPTSHIDFDINVAREQSNQNPVYYVQYAHARIASILRKASEMNFVAQQVDEYVWHEKEIALVRELALFPELIEDIARSYEVHRLPHYAIALADKFHSFYSACKVIDEAHPNETAMRLKIVSATKIVLSETLRLIGVSAPEKM